MSNNLVKEGYNQAAENYSAERDSFTNNSYLEKMVEDIGGNQELADILKKVPVSWSIKEYPLKDLKRIVGPEEGMAYPEDTEKWESRVNELVEKIRLGEQIPPLIVSNNSGDLVVNNGNHRYETLLRSGIEEYYCIFTLVKT